MSGKRLSAVTTGVQPHGAIVFTIERESFRQQSLNNTCASTHTHTHAKRRRGGRDLRACACNNAYVD